MNVERGEKYKDFRKESLKLLLGNLKLRMNENSNENIFYYHKYFAI